MSKVRTRKKQGEEVEKQEGRVEEKGGNEEGSILLSYSHLE